jgi:hypothetical protein
VAGLVTEEELAHAHALEKRAHGMRVNIAVPGAGRHRERGLPGAAVPEVRHLRLAGDDRVGRLDPLHRRVVVIGG